MRFPQSLLRAATVLAATAGFATATATASAAPADADSQRSDNAPGGAVSHVDVHRPAGAGHGRKIG